MWLYGGISTYGKNKILIYLKNTYWAYAVAYKDTLLGSLEKVEMFSSRGIFIEWSNSRIQAIEFKVKSDRCYIRASKSVLQCLGKGEHHICFQETHISCEDSILEFPLHLESEKGRSGVLNSGSQ